MFRRAIFGMIFGAAALPAMAQYQCIKLYPNGFGEYGQALGIGGGQQAGYAFDNGGSRQAVLLWTGSAGSAVNILPDDVEWGGAVNATDGVHQVGWYQRAGQYNRACMWSGTKSSFINLNPFNSVGEAYDLYGNDQVGYFYGENNSTGPYAALWHGSETDYDILSNQGIAYGAGPGEQVGAALLPAPTAGGSYFGAVLWHGTAESMVVLAPDDSIYSNAYGTDGSHQVGVVMGPDYHAHACIWNGTADSLVDLHPLEIDSISIANKISNGRQCGYVIDLNGGYPIYHAAVWSGTADSYVDLNQFLPPGEFTGAVATNIDADGNVVGYGVEPFYGLGKPLMWKKLPPLVFSKFQQPLNDPASPESVVKFGSVLPVKFKLTTGEGAAAPGMTVTISLTLLGTTEQAVNETAYYLAADSGTTFRDSGGGTYTYNLSTKGLSAGARYRVTATLPGGASHSCTFAVR